MISLDAHDPAGAATGLTPEEDGVLRRLHFFETSGLSLAIPMQELKAELRARDKRIEIREPVTARILWPVAG
ncbi:MAG: hypothetical protein LC789_03910 [Actinobacteria bacterium]|nr:hypothetical protein [Actinomycetota bacterium]MCA1719625.1 hypothetical protein [Actinomycetota bacterium]